MSKVIRFLALALVLALVVGLSLGLVGCAETQYQPGGEPSPAPAAEKLQILSHSMSIDQVFGRPVVQGIAKNVSSTNLSYARVNVKFYDAEGNLLVTSLDNILDLAPDETWSFEVRYSGSNPENVKSYKIGVGEAW